MDNVQRSVPVGLEILYYRRFRGKKELTLLIASDVFNICVLSIAVDNLRTIYIVWSLFISSFCSMFDDVLGSDLRNPENTV